MGKLANVFASKVWWCFVGLILFAVFSLKYDGANAGSLKVKVKSLPSIELFDANPKFISPGLTAILNPQWQDISFTEKQRLRTVVDGFSKFDRKNIRFGAWADGESRLLVRAEVSGKGNVRCAVTSIDGKREGNRNGTCKVLLAPDPVATIPSNFPGAAGGGTVRHYVYLLYQPPETFGKATTADLMLLQQLGRRHARIEITWTDAETKKDYTFGKLVYLDRPPVVLVHGTYDNPDECWAWGKTDIHYKSAPPSYQTDNIAGQLRAKGFKVYLVDYRRSNGLTKYDADFDLFDDRISIGSNIRYTLVKTFFRDNQKVIWEGQSSGSSGKGKGIKHALKEARDAGIAATQVDAVGHSMGGVLIRAYARGVVLPRSESGEMCLPANRSSVKNNWYWRDDNFRKGDINRIITIGSTHKGSHMSGLLQHFAYYGEHSPAGSENRRNRPISAAEIRRLGSSSAARHLGNLYWAGGDRALKQFQRGAFTDQIPGSDALLCLGPTTVPAHAIAAYATQADLDLFAGAQGKTETDLGGKYLGAKKGLYGWRRDIVWSLTRDWFIVEIFKRLNQHQDAKQMGLYLREIKRQKAFRWDKEIALTRQKIINIGIIMLRLSSQNETRFWLGKEKMQLIEVEKSLAVKLRKLKALEERARLRFMDATFANDRTDYTVSLDSQLGGLSLSNGTATLLPKGRNPKYGILHGYEPRHHAVQKAVIGLLEGSMDAFAPKGFPDIKNLGNKGFPKSRPPTRYLFEDRPR